MGTLIMKKLIALFTLLISFSGFAGSQYAIIGDGCWRCEGGSFKSGQIECTPERTARLYEVSMNNCGSAQSGNQYNGYSNYQAAPGYSNTTANNYVDEAPVYVAPGAQVQVNTNSNAVRNAELNSINNEIQMLEQKLSKLKNQARNLNY